jgi:hypothetical protein
LFGAGFFVADRVNIGKFLVIVEDRSRVIYYSNTYSHRDMGRADMGNRQLYHLADILCYRTWDHIAALPQSISKWKGQIMSSKALRIALRRRINSDA